MGSSSCSNKGAKHAQNNPDDKIGQVIAIDPGCGLAGTAQNSLGSYIPNNGEYVWAGEGNSCHYCSTEPPKEISCSSGCDGIGCCAIIGAKGTYKRKSYNANPIDCCLKQVKTIGNETCDPVYRSNTKDDCRTIIKNYCEIPTNFPNGTCQQFCSQEQTQGRATCDTAVQNYCKSNPQNPHCQCLLPPEKIEEIRKNYGDIVGDITCWYDGCQISKNPYMTLNMRNVKNNCKTTNCIIRDINVTTNGKVSDLNIMNNCGIPPPPKPSPKPSTKPTQPDENKKQIDKKLIYEEIGIAVAVIILLLILMKQ
jgi:hypothetical protein